MIVSGLAVLASNTNRTKAYLQILANNDLKPELCIVYDEDINALNDETEKYTKKVGGEIKYFNSNEPLIWTLEHHDIKYITVPTKDINSDDMINCIKKQPQKYFVYAGYGGYILNAELFKLGKKYIHVHAGILPEYRGSTTIYYSYLEKKQFGATALFLSEGIDEGEVLCQKIYDIADDEISIDYIYEPYLRSQVLLQVVKKLAVEGMIKSEPQSEKNAQTYFIIHPVLKHLAILGVEKQRKMDN